MTHSTIYVLVSALFILLMASVWSKRGWQNQLIKFTLFLLATWGGFEFLTLLGYIIKS